MKEICKKFESCVLHVIYNDLLIGVFRTKIGNSLRVINGHDTFKGESP